jgi:hypothetical protein
LSSTGIDDPADEAGIEVGDDNDGEVMENHKPYRGKT